MKKRHLITSALPYINGVKHLGNLVGSLLPADVYARFLRMRGEDVVFICGTDEHGTPAEIGAHQEGKSVQQYCDEKYEQQLQIYRSFRLSFDHFGRTSGEENKTTTQAVFSALDKNGYISEREIKQLYSLDEGRFLPDRYVEGTCPKCGYLPARGDQCDGCGSLLDPLELVQPRSTITGSRNLEVRSTTHLFLRLDLLSDTISEWVNTHDDWSPTVRGIARKWLDEGIRERGITRDLSWGVPVNKPDFESKVFYVWFDAPIAYISFTKEWARKSGHPEAWTQWWQDPANVELVQFMAKDNVPFHTVFWPGMMLGTRKNWVMANQIKGFNWLTYQGGKFSTSMRRGIFMDTALELFPADHWRYGLLSMAPEGDDSDFSIARFAAIINKDLADILGNFLGRTHALIEKHFSGRLPDGYVADQAVVEQVSEKAQSYLEELSKLRFRSALHALRAMWVLGNEYVAAKQPWALAKTDRVELAHVLKNCLYLQNVYSRFASPFLPDLAARIAVQPEEAAALGKNQFHLVLDHEWLRGELDVGKPDAFIEKISDENVSRLTKRFDGSGGRANEA